MRSATMNAVGSSNDASVFHSMQWNRFMLMNSAVSVGLYKLCRER